MVGGLGEVRALTANFVEFKSYLVSGTLKKVPITQIMVGRLCVEIVGLIGLAIWEEFAQTDLIEIALYNRWVNSAVLPILGDKPRTNFDQICK